MSIKRFKWHAIAGAAAAAAYLLFSPKFCQPLYKRHLFFPQEGRSDNYNPQPIDGVDRQVVAVPTVHGQMLDGWFFANGNSQRVLLYCHGNNGNIASRFPLIKCLLEAGTALLVFDYRGFGRSPGNPSVQSICQDALAAYDWLVTVKGYRAQDIVLYGESMGAAVASQVADQRPCAGIILQSGFHSLQKIGRENVPVLYAYPQLLYPRPRLNTAAIMQRPHPPLLIMHGEKDQIIPIDHARLLFDQSVEPKKLVTMPTAAHAQFNADTGLLIKTVASFIASLADATDNPTQA